MWIRTLFSVSRRETQSKDIYIYIFIRIDSIGINNLQFLTHTQKITGLEPSTTKLLAFSTDFFLSSFYPYFFLLNLFSRPEEIVCIIVIAMREYIFKFRALTIKCRSCLSFYFIAAYVRSRWYIATTIESISIEFPIIRKLDRTIEFFW